MARKKQQPKEAPRRKRRGFEERIADLEARIATIKEHAARKQAKADPALRHVSAAVRSIDKALAATKDATAKESLGEARSTLVVLLGGAMRGSVNSRIRRSAVEIDDLAGALLNYVSNNPGQRSEEIAAAMAVDTTSMRPVMKRLIAEGKVTTEGQKRAMKYSPA